MSIQDYDNEIIKWHGKDQHDDLDYEEEDED